MYIFHNLKLLYIIVPGTGSNSLHSQLRMKHPLSSELYDTSKISEEIKSQFQNRHPAHFTANQLQQVVDPDLWNNYTKIAFVRNPYDWVKSLYQKGGIEVLGLNNSGTITEFVKNINITPYDWFTNAQGDVIIDKIYRTEDLNDKIFDEFGLVKKHQNKSTPKPFTFSDEDKEIIRQKFHREFKHYE